MQYLRMTKPVQLQKSYLYIYSVPLPLSIKFFGLFPRANASIGKVTNFYDSVIYLL